MGNNFRWFSNIQWSQTQDKEGMGGTLQGDSQLCQKNKRGGGAWVSLLEGDTGDEM